MVYAGCVLFGVYIGIYVMALMASASKADDLLLGKKQYDED
jgi:hypothetical protein